MQTRVAKVSKDTVDILNEAGALLRSGELVAFPTETVYGLGANALDKTAVTNVFKAKGMRSPPAISAAVWSVTAAKA